jgi:DNA-binding NarL/FixJ family response regulator
VLLVDDHRCLLTGLAHLIDARQPRMKVVGVATCGAQARAHAQRCHPDVAVVDLSLEGESGLDLITPISSNGNCKVLILTASRDPEMTRHAMLQGAMGIVHKSVDIGTLTLAIERVHAGEAWVDRDRVGQLLQSFSNHRKPHSDVHGLIESLTPRERQIIRAVVRHRNAGGREIAASLFISEHTLRNRLTTIFSKLNVKNRVSLVLFAIEHHLCKEGPDDRRS